MANRIAQTAEAMKLAFASAFTEFVSSLSARVSTESGEWTVKGFVDVYRNIYTISSDTKIVSKILEIHLFPVIFRFAESIGYSVVLADKQNWYPDLSFVHKGDSAIKFAVDLKTTYRTHEFPGHVNGFTLGSHGEYFKNRRSTKNIQFPYSEYAGHFCLGVIYTRADGINEYQINTIDGLKSIVSVVKDFQFFFCEKWQIASDREGSSNTANIGSITAVDDIFEKNGMFAKLGEEWFDEYWINYKIATIKKGGKLSPIRRLADFVEFKGGDKSKIVPIKSKRRRT